ncbi:MAG TPA: Fur family transcriptional regulator [Tissierellaceae bacterium]|nr:Fur family transcriptional regulator [Tissierellaceae bacterium]
MEISAKELRKKLEENNIRPSFQRIKIFQYLLNNRCHPTVEMIYDELHKEMPTLSKTTVYNTLNLFDKANLVRVLSFDGVESRYDINTKDHGHFICESCSNIYDFPIDINSLRFSQLEDFEIKEKNIYFKGLCNKCIN